MNGLDFSYSNNYNKSTNLMCSLIVSPLVVRRTFYLVVNDLTLIVIIIFYLDYRYQLYLYNIAIGDICQEII